MSATLLYLTAALYFGVAIDKAMHSDWPMCIAFVFWASANIALSFVGKS